MVDEVKLEKCRFCQGVGRDPYMVLSELSACPICLGRGEVLVPDPNVACAHCEGTGSIKTFSCGTCGGKGVVAAPKGPTVTCPECGGSGDDHGNSAMSCMTCRGRGWLATDS